MISDRTQTVRADIVDQLGRIQTGGCSTLGTISAKRVYGGTDVPLTVTVFDPHLPVPDNSIRFYYGVGSISFTLDDGASVPPGELEITVEVDGVSASKRLTVIAPPAFRPMSGTLAGADLVWGPDENIRVTGNLEVPTGTTLTIHEGTLVMVDTTGTNNNGTLLTVNGGVSAVGTEDKPIHFFSERGPSAMTLTQSGSHSNANAWQGIVHTGNRTSTYSYVFLTGAGNGQVLIHPRPPILRLNDTHNLFMDHFVFADDDGMGISPPSRGTFTVRDSLFSRCGIGAEFAGNGETLTLEDSWFTSIGRAPVDLDLDGDCVHIDGARSTQNIRRCVFTDGGDDGIDHSDSTFTVEDSIISDLRDKAVSMTGGFATFTNMLIWGTGVGIRGDANCTNCTIASPFPMTLPHSVQDSVIWPETLDTCASTVDYTIVGNPGSLGCGTGNLSVDPQYQDTGACNYAPAAGSPALTAGSTGRRIGWLGFPGGKTCQSSAECNDGNVCTTDVCGTSGTCENTAITGCLPCTTVADRDDGDPCTVDTCSVGGTCGNGAVADGTACDDGIACTADECVGGTCVGTQSCPPGNVCDVLGVCNRPPVTVSYQNDGTYSGTQDTWLGDDLPGVPNGNRDHIRWDVSGPAQEYALIRFDGIFGIGAGQIPSASSIGSATLTLNVFNLTTGTPGELHEAAVGWDEATTTWNNFGGDPGPQADEIGAFVATAPLSGVSSMDVTSSIASWVGNPSSNLGWILVPLSLDEARAYSSEATVISNRPKLTVTYFAPIPCLGDGDCNDGIFCNGAEVCSGGFCGPALSPPCDDGAGCTADSCDEGLDTCVHVGNDALCDDGISCNGVETCGVSGCQSGTPDPLPVELGGFGVQGASSTTISWTAQGAGIRYDVASGSILSLRIDSGVVNATCLADDLTGTSTIDSQPSPAPGSGYYYIGRAQNECANGTYGYASGGQERLPTAACP
jgi:hypothetical protein